MEDVSSISCIFVIPNLFFKSGFACQTGFSRSRGICLRSFLTFLSRKKSCFSSAPFTAFALFVFIGGDVVSQGVKLGKRSRAASKSVIKLARRQLSSLHMRLSVFVGRYRRADHSRRTRRVQWFVLVQLTIQTLVTWVNPVALRRLSPLGMIFWR